MRSLIVVVGMVMVLLTGCEEQTITNEPDEPGSEQGTQGTQGTQEEEEEAEPLTAEVGDAITLAGSDEDLRVEVTLMEMIDPAKGRGQFNRPSKGARLVAVRLRLANVGEAAYSDSPSNGIALVDTDDQQYDASFMEVREGQALTSVNISPGDRRSGVIVFEIPKGVGLRSFQMTLDSGFAPQTGQWEIDR